MFALKDLKALEPEDILSLLSIPVIRSGRCLMTYALWRYETRPSIGLRCAPISGDWVYVDYGDQYRGGSMIDYIARVSGLSVGAAIRWLDSYARNDPGPLTLRYPVPQVPLRRRNRSLANSSRTSLEILSTCPVASEPLPPPIAAELWEHRRLRSADLPPEINLVRILIHPYECTKILFGARNNSGHWEYCSAAPRNSNAGFAGNVGGKDILLLGGAGDDLCIVEGLWDACAMRASGWKSPILTLTSTSLAKRATLYLSQKHSPEMGRILFALDSDDAGQTATKVLMQCKGFDGKPFQREVFDLKTYKDPSDYYRFCQDGFCGGTGF